MKILLEAMPRFWRYLYQSPANLLCFGLFLATETAGSADATVQLDGNNILIHNSKKKFNPWSFSTKNAKNQPEIPKINHILAQNPSNL